MIFTTLGANGPYPGKLGACSGYLLTSDSGKTRLLIDCGGGVLGRLANECDIADLSAVALSHLHFDHMSDMLPMRYMLDFSQVASLKVFCPETPAKVRALLEGGKFDLYAMNDAIVGEMKLEFLKVNHPVEAYALRVFCDGCMFVYTGDTNHADALPLFADGADLLLADAGLSSEDWTPKKPHMSAAMCGMLARDARVKELVLTHILPKYSAEALIDEAQQYFPGARLARAGVRVCV